MTDIDLEKCIEETQQKLAELKQKLEERRTAERTSSLEKKLALQERIKPAIAEMKRRLALHRKEDGDAHKIMLCARKAGNDMDALLANAKAFVCVCGVNAIHHDGYAYCTFCANPGGREKQLSRIRELDPEFYELLTRDGTDCL
jgi:hypothetical protein